MGFKRGQRIAQKIPMSVAIIEGICDEDGNVTPAAKRYGWFKRRNILTDDYSIILAGGLG